MLAEMASAAPIPRGSCGNKKLLFEEFKAANQQLVWIHSQEIEAAVNQNLEAALALHLELTQARKRRDTAAENLKCHMLLHGC